ncbi:unnamed protein product [Schistosoma margrebowiei]|uniref:Uncharacterized protein n=1 Tax=Schistosoma margrebowiei TaxID=48269 RepID=A0A183LGR9_9TREM|nr:unnamed protein product [Schistosoma margrebowiei]
MMVKGSQQESLGFGFLLLGNRQQGASIILSELMLLDGFGPVQPQHTQGENQVLKFKTKNNNPVTLDGESLEHVESFTYLGSIIDEQGGSDTDIKSRIGKARATFLRLRNKWNSKQLSTNIKVRIFNTNVKAVLLYGAETWRTTTTTIKKVQVFINSCLRKILNIHWPDTISNSLL